MDMDNRKVFEDALLRAMDTIAGQAKDNTTKDACGFDEVSCT